MQEENPLALQMTTGSFDRLQIEAKGQLSGERTKTFYSLNHNQTAGYRDHNALNRQVYQLSHQIQFNTDNQLQLHGLFSDLNYEIPGGLTQQQFEENPSQARAGSAGQNASIDQKTILLGANYLGFINEKLNHSTNIGITYTDFENPFILDYKQDVNRELALRHQWTYKYNIANINWQWDAGLEYQYGNNKANNFGNVAGVKDTVRFKDKLIIDRKTFFGQLQLAYNRWKATIGLSSNLLTYQVDRYQNAFAMPFEFERKFDNELIPRLALQYGWNNSQSTFASVSQGFSSPTLDEIRTNEGSINRELEAEKGITYEVGHKIQHQKLQLDASIFVSQLSETITTFTNPDGVVLFRNAGATTQQGFELGLNVSLIDQGKGLLANLNSRTAYQYYNFTFDNYIKRETDFSGNYLPGVPKHTFNQVFSAEFQKQFTLNLHYRFVSETPLTDSNEVIAEAYHLVNLKINKRLAINNTAVNVFAGAENILDIAYSLGNDLNAFGGRYFQPAPGRNYFVGIKLNL